MNKEEILKKSRTENMDMDEREKHIDDLSAYYGLLGAIIIAYIYIFVKSFKHLPVTDMLSISTMSLAVMSFYKYKKIPNKKIFLISGIIASLLTLIFMAIYFMEA